MLPNQSSYGLFICDHYTGTYGDGNNPYDEYALRYRNIQAYRSGGWSYKFFGYTSGFPKLFLSPKDDDRDGVTDENADIFAYAPWMEGLTRLEEIPFCISDAVDVMYAEENTHPTTNKDIDPATDSRITAAGSDGFQHLEVPLHFRHALALLEFDLRLKNGQYNYPDPVGNGPTVPYTLNHIRIVRKEGGHPLYASGTMDAMGCGALSNLVKASGNTLTVSNLAPHPGGTVTVGPGTTPSNPARAYILQVPSQTGESYGAGGGDGDYTFHFHFSGQEFPVTFTLLKEHLREAGAGEGEDVVFKPGYRYTFKFVIDNYIHFEGLTIDEWETVADPIDKIEI